MTVREATSWQDQADFYDGDPARVDSDEVDRGTAWRGREPLPVYRCTYLTGTGELVLVRTRPAGGPGVRTVYDGTMTGPKPEVILLGWVPTVAHLDAALKGWEAAHNAGDGIAWLRGRIYRHGVSADAVTAEHRRRVHAHNMSNPEHSPAPQEGLF